MQPPNEETIRAAVRRLIEGGLYGARFTAKNGTRRPLNRSHWKIVLYFIAEGYIHPHAFPASDREGLAHAIGVKPRSLYQILAQLLAERLVVQEGGGYALNPDWHAPGRQDGERPRV